MSDFYQILKRETVSIPENSKTDDRENFDKKNNEAKAVEKPLPKITPRPPAKKTKKAGRVNKKNPAQKKEPEIKPENKTKISQLEKTILSGEPSNPVWLTMAETAKLGGLKKRTIKRALRGGLLKYRIVEKRYRINLRSAILYFHSRKKLWNKLENFGFGQYVEKWKE